MAALCSGVEFLGSLPIPATRRLEDRSIALSMLGLVGVGGLGMIDVVAMMRWCLKNNDDVLMA